MLGDVLLASLVVIAQQQVEHGLHLGNVLGLHLDEAARLDARSIATLFELCERLDMQLIIAAPENISPEKGTTYKLVRKVFQNSEHVHVVGLRGFAPQPPESLPETTADAS